jgi:hypothetical protein
MDNCEFLTWYGALVMLLTGGIVLVPFLRRNGELISARNILLVGLAIFLGVGCFEAAISPMRFHGLQWFQPTSEEVNRFLIASTIFLVVFLVSYYYDPISRALAARTLNNWPPVTTGLIVFVLIVCSVLTVASQIRPLLGITFVGPLLINVSHKAIVFACVFSFVLWYRQKLNIAWMAMFIAVFLAACLLSILASGGRRLLLSVFLAPVLVVYYVHARHWRPTKSMAVIAMATLCIFIINLMYSSIRHFDRRGEKRERSAALAIEQVKNLGAKDWFGYFASNTLFHFSQQNVHYSMFTDRVVRTGLMQPEPFNTFRFLVSYPIPRRIWSEKPRPLGSTIGEDIRRIASVRNQGIRWGCGIAGQAAYEGGLLLAALFAYMAAMGVRMIDDPLQRQPTNPFLVAVLASASTHILAWPRGDLGIMTIEIAECFLFAIALAIAGRIIFGTDRTMQSVRRLIPGASLYRHTSAFPRA